MQRIFHIRRTGEAVVYEYAPQEYVDAVQICRRALSRMKRLHLFGKNRWRTGPHGRLFNGTTVARLIAAGEAVRDGNIVRAA